MPGPIDSRHDLIDLTLDDEGNKFNKHFNGLYGKTMLIDSGPSLRGLSSTPPFAASSVMLDEESSVPIIKTVDDTYLERTPSQFVDSSAFAGPSHPSAFFLRRSDFSSFHADDTDFAKRPIVTSHEDIRQVIDLTSSPSPPPDRGVKLKYPSYSTFGELPPNLPPNTPVCVGQINITALILYPIDYLRSFADFHEMNGTGANAEWVPVRLHYDSETKQKNPGSQDTIHIITPHNRALTGDLQGGETFGVVEQKAASVLGPMLDKGIIRLDARVRRGAAKLPILPLQSLVYTPKGNISFVASLMQQSGLLLDHPSSVYGFSVTSNGLYVNPHNPPPHGHVSSCFNSRWNPQSLGERRWNPLAVPEKSVEVHRSQIEEVFRSLRGGDELEETQPSHHIATPLYPHQRKALTFLLEREKEKLRGEGKFSSLWQMKSNPKSFRRSWINLVTQREIYSEPVESKSALLADDMGLGKTITCVSLIAHTLQSAQTFASLPLPHLMSTPIKNGDDFYFDTTHYLGSVWNTSRFLSPKASSLSEGKANSKMMEKFELRFKRTERIKVRSRATLIICPLSTVANWEEQFREHWSGDVFITCGAGSLEISSNQAQQSLPSTWSAGRENCKRFSDDHRSCQSTSDFDTSVGSNGYRVPLKVYVYHGNSRRLDPYFLADFDAVITTYSTLAMEYSKQNRSPVVSNVQDMEESEETEKGSKRKKVWRQLESSEVTSPLQSIYWFRVVLDEAHSIKETSTVGSRAACDLVADRRLCLTGTPVQNKLDDVYALIRFLRLEPFDERSVWQEFIGVPVKFGQPLGIERLQTIMKCITLRRTKESKTEDGQKLLSLPPRRDELRLLKFDDREQSIYDQFFNESKAEFTELSHKNEVMKNYVGILQKILRLRQICDHYELVRGKGHLNSLMNHDKAAVDDDFNLPWALAIFVLLRDAGTAQCVECQCELGHVLDSYLEENSEYCRDGLPAAKRGKKGKSSTSGRTTSPSSNLKPFISRCQHLYCGECLRMYVFPFWPNIGSDVIKACSVCQINLRVSDVLEIDSINLPIEHSYQKRIKKENLQKTVCLETFHPSTKVKALLGDLVVFSRGNPYSSNYDPKSIEVQMVDEKGNDVDDGVVKTVVFSQWTSMLDKVEEALDAAGIQFDRLDGTMKREERIRAMDALKYDNSCEVLLVSLKAGGVGLNLTAAQRVYLMDPYWNPAVENQAVDRIHRLGQTRPVTTVRLIIENTIEARLLEVQRKKTALANMTLGQHLSKSELLQRRMDELKQLFG